ncbi:ABC transporter ATP-binding protein [Actinocorallia lasiicapitis]
MDLIEITHGYGETEVLHGVDLALRPGEVVALLGPSGSGKTTLLAVAGGLLRPSSGRVEVAGNDLYRDRRRPHDVAFVLQGGALIPYLTARENLLVRSVVAREAPDPARADELLAAVDLAGKAGRYPSELSGGERQRVCVAQALYTGAKVLLADEPTAALDRERGRAVMELLRRHARAEDAAVLVATHDERALDLVDHIVGIEDGRVRAVD